MRVMIQLAGEHEGEEVLPGPGVSGGPIFDCEGRLVSVISEYREYPKFDLPPALKSMKMRPSSVRGFTFWEEKPTAMGLNASVIKIDE